MEHTLEQILEWAEARNLIQGSNPQAQMLKLTEEMGELASGIAKDNPQVIEDSIGDAIVVLTIISAQMGLNIPDCTKLAYNEIRYRKGKMVDGVFVKEEDM